MAQSTSKKASDFHKRLQFLRVLIPNPFVKLRIPCKIARHLQNEHHKRATFYGPYGKFCHINLLREGDDMYFDEGWAEFSKAHDLRTGYFVLFRYVGNMVFNVKVFDNTMCLKEYERERGSCKRPISDLFEGIDQAGPCNDDSTRSLLDSSCKRKKQRREELLNQDECKEERERLLDEETLKTSPYSCAFPKFEKIIRPYNLTSKGMCVPKSFCKRHGIASGRVIFIVNTEGRSWPIWFYPKIDDMFFGKGFRDFVKDSGLKLGHKCIFQLVKRNTFLVHVVASEEAERETLRYNTSLVKVTKIEKYVRTYNYKYITLPWRFCVTNGLISNHRIYIKTRDGRSWPIEFFVKTYDSGRLGKGWAVFMKDNKVKVGDQCVFQLVQNDTLLVHVVYSEERTTVQNQKQSNKAGPSGPIKAPKEEINEIGAECSPIIIEKPSIAREIEEISDKGANDMILYGTEIEKEPSIGEPSIIQEEEIVGTNAPNSNSYLIGKGLITEIQEDETINNVDDSIQFPELEKIISPYNLTHNYTTLSKTFVRENGLVSRCNMILKDSDGKSWDISYTPYQGQGCLGKGWLDFRKDKGLKVGDKCIFKLVSKSVFFVRVEKKPPSFEGPSIEAQDIPLVEAQDIPLIEDGPIIEIQKHDINLIEKESLSDDSNSIRFPEIEKIITPCSLNNAQTMLSKEFCKDSDLLSTRDITLQDCDGNSWVAKFRHLPNREKGYIYGWKNFIKDKRLDLGDKCVFKLVDKDTFLVSVVKGTNE